MKKRVSHWECVCDRCSHQWVTRTEKLPKACPGCRSWNWDDDHDQDVLEAEDIRRDAEGTSRKGAEGLRKPAAEKYTETPRSVPVEDDWTGWSDERETRDDDRGEKVYYREHLKTRRRKEVRREAGDWSA